MESVVKHSSLVYLWILSKPALNSNFTSIEYSDIAPEEVTLNPKFKCSANGIDLTFSEENWILSTHVWFHKIYDHSYHATNV
jgi:hypothetical protein